MLEILLLFKLCKHIGLLAKEKGLKPIKYQLLLIVLWIGVECVVGTSGYLTLFFLYGEEQAEALYFAFYFIALVGSVISVWLLFNYVKSLPQKKSIMAF